MKRRINTWTLLGNWKTMEHEGDNYTSHDFSTVTKGLLKGLEDLEILHYWEWPEYWKESWKLEETCCHSNSSESLSAKTKVENSQGVDSNNSIKLLH